MCGCAGSSTKPDNKFVSCTPRNRPDCMRSFSKWYFAGQVRMDLELGRTRVHEHTETGKPLAAHNLHAAPRSAWGLKPRPLRAVRPCKRHGWNGPTGYFGFFPPHRQNSVNWGHGVVGHKLSAIGSPERQAVSSSSLPQFALRAALTGCRRSARGQAGNALVFPSPHPQSSRFRASPSFLAVGPG